MNQILLLDKPEGRLYLHGVQEVLENDLLSQIDIQCSPVENTLQARRPNQFGISCEEFPFELP